MTKSKRPSEHEPSALELSQYRLRNIAKLLGDRSSLDDVDVAFIVNALNNIGNGGDANRELGVLGGKGQKKSKESVTIRERKLMACHWMASVMRPVHPQNSPDYSDSGEGYGLKKAAHKAGETFDFTAKTLLSYWYKHPELRTASFPAPISSYPRE